MLNPLQKYFVMCLLINVTKILDTVPHLHTLQISSEATFLGLLSVSEMGSHHAGTFLAQLSVSQMGSHHAGTFLAQLSVSQMDSHHAGTSLAQLSVSQMDSHHAGTFLAQLSVSQMDSHHAGTVGIYNSTLLWLSRCNKVKQSHSPKDWLIQTALQGIISQKTGMYISTAVVTSNCS
jgi:hypothetical protein